MHYYIFLLILLILNLFYSVLSLSRASVKDLPYCFSTTGPMDNEEFITYGQIYQEVCQYARALRTLGVKKGDCIGCEYYCES